MSSLLLYFSCHFLNYLYLNFDNGLDFNLNFQILNLFLYISKE